MRIYKTPRALHSVFPKRTWGFSLDKNEVYLTFDDGPNPEITPWILDELAKHAIHATFFCVGENILRYPQLFERIKKEGHQVGSHTMKHEKSPETEWSVYKKSVKDCAALVGNNLFRPPYGRLSSWRARYLAKSYRIIMWTWLSYDYDAQVPVKEILGRAEREVKPGSILVLHDNQKVVHRVKEILPPLIDIIQKKDLKCRTISS